DSEAGAFEFGSTSLPALAVDQSNGHVYVTDLFTRKVVDEFDGAGSFVSQLASGSGPNFEEPLGRGAVAVDNGAASPNRGTVYFPAPTEAKPQAAVYAFGPLTYGKSLTVFKDGPGTGTVTSNPAGIDCGTTCHAGFADDTPVVLTASP